MKRLTPPLAVSLAWCILAAPSAHPCPITQRQASHLRSGPRSVVQVLLALLPSCGGALKSHPQALTLLALVYGGASAPSTTPGDMQALQDIAEACTTPAAPPSTLLAAVQLALALHHKVRSGRTGGVRTSVRCLCRFDHAAGPLDRSILLTSAAGPTHASGQFGGGSSLENLGSRIKLWVR